MDVVMLSRLQFAVAVFFHFIFVPLTLGLSMLLAFMETAYVKTGNEQYKRMAKFWGKLFLLNFALGVVTGITLEFQFGTNWSQYSEFVGNIFGPLLAIEATAAFFLESTFIAVWHFGWDRISKKLHLLAIWLVAIAGNVSAIWIILANGWMQNPVGYEIIANGQAALTENGFYEVLTNPFAWEQLVHTLAAAWMLGAFFVIGISAWHLVRKNEVDLFSRSFNMGAWFAFILSIVLIVQGHQHGMMVAKTQPTKLAAMESLWEDTPNAPIYMLLWPDEKNEKNAIELLPVPGFLSFLATGDPSATVKGIKSSAKADFEEFVSKTNYSPDKVLVTLPDGTEIKKELTIDNARPPVLLTFASFRIMVGLAMLFPVLSLAAIIYRKKIGDKPLLAKILVYSIPLPYIAIMAGWTVAEVGRQPWIVYKLMTTMQAVSPVDTQSVAVSLIAFIVVYTILGVLDIYLLCKFARKGPEAPAHS